MLQRCGTRLLNLSKRDKGRSTSASFAMAVTCNTVLVEPPRAISTIIAFSKESEDKMSRGFKSSFTNPTTLSPVALATLNLSALTAGGVAHPGSDIPNASVTHAIVFAVNMPLHDP